ncbi:polyprenyl synthetase family protein [Phytomonospora endophytica]|uniref:Heptaprenyl diphosphate synthase n=1 Tax=Phytomonospora endophytica TaxID=714109 RepID=A0A841FMM6_9ACTN|nr:heptaprenyl diphosphate synthase [Phytomonospora endophytica]GIG69354.1 geranylgeranyl pyrophosphate synthase [Phytomonospora endophytica]
MVSLTQTPSSAPVDINFDDPALTAAVQQGLDEVEARLREAVDNADPLIAEAAAHLILAGGKRFRPMLVLLASHFGDPAAPGITDAAAVMELTHLATLYHDDVMDEAPVRRGAPSANSRWGNTFAILTGDYLFARASDITASLGAEAVRKQAGTFARLVAGQIAETAGPRGADPVEFYLHVLAEKTGSLIATSAHFGATFAGASPDVVEALSDFGEVIGVAFQLSDDLLDIASESNTSGKTLGTDLLEGVPTLPVLYALASDDPAETRLRELVAGPVAEADLPEALALLRASKAMAQARATLDSYGAKARAIVDSLPDVPARRALDAVCAYMVSRTA